MGSFTCVCVCVHCLPNVCLYVTVQQFVELMSHAKKPVMLIVVGSTLLSVMM